MATKKNSENKDNSRCGDSVRLTPVNLSEIEFVNKPTKCMNCDNSEEYPICHESCQLFDE